MAKSIFSKELGGCLHCPSPEPGLGQPGPFWILCSITSSGSFSRTPLQQSYAINTVLQIWYHTYYRELKLPLNKHRLQLNDSFVSSPTPLEHSEPPSLHMATAPNLFTLGLTAGGFAFQEERASTQRQHPAGRAAGVPRFAKD